MKSNIYKMMVTVLMSAFVFSANVEKEHFQVESDLPKSIEKPNFIINNLDINLICEQPKVSKYRNKIVNSISKIMNLNNNQINLKGKTVEKLGLIGKEKAIACEVIISITKYD